MYRSALPREMIGSTLVELKRTISNLSRRDVLLRVHSLLSADRQIGVEIYLSLGIFDSAALLIRELAQVD